MKYSPCAPSSCYPSAQHCGIVLALCQPVTFKYNVIVVYLMTVQHIARSEDEYVEDLSSVLEHTFNKMNAHGVENIKVKVSDLNSHDDFMAIHVILEPVNDQQFINLDHTFTETLEIMKSLGWDMINMTCFSPPEINSWVDLSFHAH